MGKERVTQELYFLGREQTQEADFGSGAPPEGEAGESHRDTHSVTPGSHVMLPGDM